MSMMDLVRRITLPPANLATDAERFIHAVMREGTIWEIVNILRNEAKPEHPVTCVAIRGRHSQRVLPFFLFDDTDFQQLHALSEMERRRKRAYA